MGTKVWSKWIKDGTAEVKNAIDSIGIWQCVDQYYEINGDVETLIIVNRDVGVDPVGTIGYVGMRTRQYNSANAYRIPEKMETSDFTLSTMAVGEQITITDYFKPKGVVCVIVTTFVAPFIVEVVQ